MMKYIPMLKEINALGYLTTESQAGRKRSGKHYLDGRPFVMEEKAYISGFMKEKEGAEFIKQMGIQTDKNAIFIPRCQEKTVLPASLDIPLTITKIGGEVKVDTHMSSAFPESWWQSQRKEAHINKNEKVVFIECWDNKWNRLASGPSGLFTDVIKVLKEMKKST